LGLRAILVPQVLNVDLLTGDEPYGWVPFVRDKDLAHAMQVYDQTMRDVAAESSAEFVASLLDEKLTTADFVDVGHFSPHGDAKFARLLANTIRGQARTP